MGDPSVVADTKRYRETVREHTALKKLEASAKRYFKLLDDIEGAESMLADPDLDPELLSEAQSEVEELKFAIPDAERDVLAGLLPPDPLEGRNACFEIRAGTGGEEAALFGAEAAQFAGIIVQSRRVDQQDGPQRQQFHRFFHRIGSQPGGAGKEGQTQGQSDQKCKKLFH